MAREIHSSHAAAGDEGLDLRVGDRGTDQWILGLDSGQITPVLASILLCLAAQTPLPIGLRLDEVQGLEPEEARALAQTLRRDIEETAGRRTFFDDAGCDREDRCVEETRSRTGSADVVLLQLYAAGTRVRLIAERAEPPSLIVQRVQADVLRERENDSLRGVAQILFPQPKTAEEEPPPALVTTPVEPNDSGAWIARGSVGLGAIAAGVAIALRISANNARDRVRDEPLGGSEIEDLKSRSDTHGLISNLLLGTGAALITGGVVYLVAD